MKARPGASRSISRSAVMHSRRSRLCTVLSDITALKLLSGNGSLTALPRWSRPTTSGSQCINADSETSRPKASRPGQTLIRPLTKKPLPQPTASTGSPRLTSKCFTISPCTRIQRTSAPGTPWRAGALAAIAVLARPMEMEVAVFARDRDDLVGLGLSAGIDVTLAARKLRKQIDFLLHHYAPSLATRASPSRSEI